MVSVRMGHRDGVKDRNPRKSQERDDAKPASLRGPPIHHDGTSARRAHYDTVTVPDIEHIDAKPVRLPGTARDQAPEPHGKGRRPAEQEPGRTQPPRRPEHGQAYKKVVSDEKPQGRVSDKPVAAGNRVAPGDAPKRRLQQPPEETAAPPHDRLEHRRR